MLLLSDCDIEKVCFPSFSQFAFPKVLKILVFHNCAARNGLKTISLESIKFEFKHYSKKKHTISFVFKSGASKANKSQKNKVLVKFGFNSLFKIFHRIF